MKYIKRIFNGRINRKNYGLGLLLTIIGFSIFTSFVLASVPKEYLVYSMIVMAVPFIFVMINTISLHVRRFHDIGWSGWTTLIMPIPGIGGIILICLLLIPSEKDTNKYGNPIASDRDFWNVFFNKSK